MAKTVDVERQDAQRRLGLLGALQLRFSSSRRLCRFAMPAAGRAAPRPRPPSRSPRSARRSLRDQVAGQRRSLSLPGLRAADQSRRARARCARGNGTASAAAPPSLAGDDVVCAGRALRPAASRAFARRASWPGRRSRGRGGSRRRGRAPRRLRSTTIGCDASTNALSAQPARERAAGSRGLDPGHVRPRRADAGRPVSRRARRSRVDRRQRSPSSGPRHLRPRAQPAGSPVATAVGSSGASTAKTSSHRVELSAEQLAQPATRAAPRVASSATGRCHHVARGWPASVSASDSRPERVSSVPDHARARRSAS